MNTGLLFTLVVVVLAGGLALPFPTVSAVPGGDLTLGGPYGVPVGAEATFTGRFSVQGTAMAGQVVLLEVDGEQAGASATRHDGRYTIDVTFATRGTHLVQAVVLPGTPFAVRSSILRVDAIVPPSGPLDVTVETTPEQRGLSVTWDAPADSGDGWIDRYVVDRQRNGTSGWSRVFEGNALARSYEEMGDWYEAYRYRVRAMNQAGAGPWNASGWAGPLVPPVPPAPTGLSVVEGATETERVVRWHLESTPEDIPVAGYRVYRGIGEGALTEIGETTGLTWSDTVDWDTEVRFAVAAFNAEGEGALAGPVDAPVAVSRAPGSVQGLEVVRLEDPDARLRIAWDETVDWGTHPPDALELERYDGTATTPARQEDLPPGTTMFEEVVAWNGSYTYRVRPVTAAGAGPWAEATIEVPPVPLPDPPVLTHVYPSYVRSDGPDEVSAFLRWDPPADAEEKGVYAYGVDRRPPGEKTWTHHALYGPERIYHYDENVTWADSFEYRIVAYGYHGETPSSVSLVSVPERSEILTDTTAVDVCSDGGCGSATLPGHSTSQSFSVTGDMFDLDVDLEATLWWAGSLRADEEATFVLIGDWYPTGETDDCPPGDYCTFDWTAYTQAVTWNETTDAMGGVVTSVAATDWPSPDPGVCGLMRLTVRSEVLGIEDFSHDEFEVCHP